MGWASGSEIACALAETISKEVEDKKARRRIYKAMVKVLDDQDWDTHDEAEGIDPVLDSVLNKT